MTETDLFEQRWHTLELTRADAVVEVRLNRPDARNALDPTLMEELTEVARRLRLRPDVAAVILTGAPDGFSAGADLRSGDRSAPRSLLERRRDVMRGPDLCRAWEEIEAVTLVAVEGYAIGGACALAVACDFRIMGQGAYFRLPEVPLGMNMSWRTLPRLVALIGPARAKRFVMFGEATDAERCLSWGLCDEVAPAGQALTLCRDWARRLAALPPLPVRMTKEALNAVSAAHQAASMVMDRDQFLLTTSTEDYREGMRAFFERRPGRFRGE